MRRPGPARAAAIGWASLLLGLAPFRPAAGRDLAYTGSLQYASGSYVLEERARGLYFLNSLGLAAGRWRVQASLPFILQTEPIAVAPDPSASGGGANGGGHDDHHPKSSTATDGAASNTHTEMGVGDLFLRADLEVLRRRGRRPGVRFIATAKAPLATRTGFGSGEWDYGAGASVAERLGRTFVFVDATYWVLEDPAAVDLRDTVAYAASVGRVHGRFGVLASVTGASRILDGVDPPAQVGGLVTYWLRPGRSLSGGASFGLTEASPDVALTLGWRIGI